MASTRFGRSIGAFCAVLGFICLESSSGIAAETIATGMIGAANAVGWPWYIGIQKGYFAEQGLNLDLVYVPTASGLVQQLSAGSLDQIGRAHV